MSSSGCAVLRQFRGRSHVKAADTITCCVAVNVAKLESLRSSRVASRQKSRKSCRLFGQSHTMTSGRGGSTDTSGRAYLHGRKRRAPPPLTSWGSHILVSPITTSRIFRTFHSPFPLNHIRPIYSLHRPSILSNERGILKSSNMNFQHESKEISILMREKFNLEFMVSRGNF